MKHVIGQHIIMGIEGPHLKKEETDFITEYGIGGVILFSRNIESPEQLHSLCNQIQSLKNKDQVPLFIGIDNEGGRVLRLKSPYTEWPPAANLGTIGSANVAFHLSQSMGRELFATGINLNFAPCVDILTNPSNQVIGDRAISSETETVCTIASALVRGFIKAGIIPCAKHFPGHGNTTVDSHDELPIENLSLEELLEREVQPFKKVLRSRVEAILPAHIKFPQIDANHPVTFSSAFLKDLLRTELRYRGLIISDDLDMKALRNHYSIEEIPIKALSAGVEVLLYCNEPESPVIAVQSIEKALKDNELDLNALKESYQHICSVKEKQIKNVDIEPVETLKSILAQENHKKLADAIRSGIVPKELISN